MQDEPAARDSQIEAGKKFVRRSLQIEQKRPVDQFDLDAAVVHHLDRVCDLKQLAGGFVWIAVGAFSGEFHR